MINTPKAIPSNQRVSRRAFLQRTTLAAGAGLVVRSAATSADAWSAPARVTGLAPLSAADRHRSPFTGYTRQHWLEIAERLLAGILPHLDPQTGMPNLKGVPGDRGHSRLYRLDPTMTKWQAMERMMMLAVYYTAATGRDHVPGWSDSISERFRTAISRMSNPADPLFCPRTAPSVYLGSETALAVMLSPKFFWEPLSAREKENVLKFLGELAHMSAYDNNHHLFHMVPVPLLERHARPSNRAHYTQILERMLSWHLGGGWFLDGGNGGVDHYNFWGFQLYLNALCHLDKPWREQFGQRWRRITAEFLQNARYFFDRQGGPIPWGRSLAYRFADTSAIGWAHLNGANPLPPGLARRMASGCLKYFWERGALDESGLLELGYHGANAVMAEDYLTDGTGYFAAQGLACLLVPENDPFWTEVELPLPADECGGRLALPGAQLVARVSPSDGEARLFPVGQRFEHEGQWQRGIKYCQHSYSSHLGWCALGEGAEDLGAGRTGWSLDGQNWVYRSHPVMTGITPEHAASVEAIDFGKLSSKTLAPKVAGQITTHTLIGDAGEIHVFWHNSPQALRLYLGGYGINVKDERRLATDATARRIHVQGETGHSWMELIEGPHGRFDVKVLQPRPGWLCSHLFGGRGVFAYWQSSGPVEPLTPVVMYVDGCVERLPATPRVRVRRGKASLTLDFEGKTHVVPYQ